MPSTGRRSETAFWLSALVLSLSLTPQRAQSQTLTVLYHFTGGADGGYPTSDVVVDTQGNVYGTTSGGGSANMGTVFRVSANGKETVIHSFTGAPDGAFPSAGLLADKNGNLYGTTYHGGDLSCDPTFGGCGTVFKIDHTGKETILHSFEADEGTNPLAGLISDTQGNLYGTTFQGGDLGCASNEIGCGTIFELDKNGRFTVLHVFAGAPDAANVSARLTLDAQGNLYGTSEAGGDFDCSPNYGGCGTVFRLDTTGHNTVLHSFLGYPTDGEVPEAPVFLDAAGNVYGTAYAGGANVDGTMFRIDPAGNQVFYSFPSGFGPSGPEGPLVPKTGGFVFGATLGGGRHSSGTIFRLDKNGRLATIHTFDGADGDSPMGGLVRDVAGNLYGTTYFGGKFGVGVVFKLSP